ncbi:IS3 family transposase [Paraburkholderia megapolitana]|uniref:IS3 family transposase n=1 Tax=Paraburkholderia megapolitana TaxID=420953 RepID=UPI0038BDD076
MKYQFISTHLHSYPVKAMCRALRISASGYYAARSRAPSKRSERQTLLTAKIHAIHIASRQTYGAPRVHAELCAQGFMCSLNTVARLMHQAQIMPKAIRRYRVTTDSRNTRKASPDLVKRIFSADRPDACWLSDITYIPTREGWLYLAAILDLHSRAVVGWAMSRTLDCRLAMDALQMAISKRGAPPGILHSDQGTTYSAVEYRALPSRYAIRQSMSRKGNCWDNAPMESFFHTLKTKLVMHCDFKTRDQARASLFEYMEVFYNRQRRHSTIGYKAPLPFEILTNAKFKVSTVRG